MRYIVLFALVLLSACSSTGSAPVSLSSNVSTIGTGVNYGNYVDAKGIFLNQDGSIELR